MERHRARFHQQANLGHRFACQMTGQRGHRRDVDTRRRRGAPADEIHQRRLVDYRVGIRHDDDGGDAARGGGAAGRFQRLAMLAARLAGEHPHIDQARRQDQSLAVDGLGIVALRVGEQPRTDVGDLAVFHQQTAFGV
jgi:hypothetical protein